MSYRPRDEREYRLHQEAARRATRFTRIQRRRLRFRASLTDLQRIASNRMKRPVVLYINYHSFAEEQRTTLRDAKINLNTLMDASGENLLKQVTFKTILDHLCWQVGATFWANPEYIEIVSRDTAKREAARQSRLMSYDLITVKVATILDQMLRCLGDDVKVRVTADHIEILRTGSSARKPEVARSPRVIS